MKRFSQMWFVGLTLLLTAVAGAAPSTAEQIRQPVVTSGQTMAKSPVARIQVGSGLAYFPDYYASVSESGSWGYGFTLATDFRITQLLPLYLGLSMQFTRFNHDYRDYVARREGGSVNDLIFSEFGVNAWNFSAAATLTAFLKSTGVVRPYLGLAIGPSIYDAEAYSRDRGEAETRTAGFDSDARLLVSTRTGIDFMFTSAFGLNLELGAGLLDGEFFLTPTSNLVFAF